MEPRSWHDRAKAGRLPPGAALPIEDTSFAALLDRIETALEAYPKGVHSRLLDGIREHIAEGRRMIAAGEA